MQKREKIALANIILQHNKTLVGFQPILIFYKNCKERRRDFLFLLHVRYSLKYYFSKENRPLL